MLAINSILKEIFSRLTVYGLKNIYIICKSMNLVTSCKLLTQAVVQYFSFFLFKVMIIMGPTSKGLNAGWH